MVSVRFGADEYQLKTTWESSIELAEKVGDPLQMAFSIKNGVQVFNTDKMVRTIWIGLKAAGEKLSFTEVGTLCHEYGLVDYMVVAGDYVIDTVTQGTEDEEPEETDTETEKK